MYKQIPIDHMAGFMCHGILKCVNFDAEIGLLTGKDFRFRSFPAIWSALFGSDNFLLSTEYIQESGFDNRAKVKDYDKKIDVTSLARKFDFADPSKIGTQKIDFLGKVDVFTPL